MDIEKHRKIKDAFARALELERDARAAFVAELEPEIAREVSALLRLDESESDRGRALDRGVTSVGTPVAAHALSSGGDRPDRIGAYEIVGVLGEGGMGVVYEARQVSPRRSVALKVIARAVATPTMLRRFEREADVLGQLQHSGIASIYEAGTAEGGEPYFAMELVRGDSLTEHARKRRLDERERLRLIARVCDAVQHAHQKGVIHRDLKPANILVDAAGNPKILDFGVARLAGNELMAATLKTDIGQIIGTLPYMSPEQAAGDPALIDRRSDVYSLGVMLFELLTGSMPYEVSGASLPEALRVIREVDPPRLRHVERGLRGDVETIVSKALDKAPERRYSSAAALADDIRRHLNNEPIIARPTTALYQLQKFARRNRAIVTGVVTAFVALIIGTGIAISFAIEATRSRHLAEQTSFEALREAYRARLAAASAAIESLDPRAHADQLAAVPEATRGWEWEYLRARIDRSDAAYFADSRILDATFSADSSQVVFVTESGRVRWWDHSRNLVLRELVLPATSLADADLARGGGLVATIEGPERRVVGRYELGETLDETRVELDGPADIVVLRDDGEMVAISTRENLLFWDGREASPALGPQEPIPAGPMRGMFFHNHSERFITSMKGARLAALSLDPLTISQIVTPGMTHVSSMAVSRDDVFAAVADVSNKVYIGQIGSVEPLFEFHGHRQPPLGLDFSPDGRFLASAGGMTVRIRELDQGAEVAVLTGHDGSVTHVEYDEAGEHLVSIGADRSVRVWPCGAPRDVGSWEFGDTHSRGLTVLADGLVIVPAFHTRFGVVDVRSGREIGLIQFMDRRHGRFLGAAVDPSTGQRFAVLSRGGGLSIWSMERGLEMLEFADLASGDFAWRSDGKAIAIRGRKSVALHEVPGLRQLASMRLRSASVSPIVGSRRGDCFIVVNGTEITLLDAETLAKIRSIPGVEGATLSCLAESDDGRLLVGGSLQGRLALWDRETGALLWSVASFAGLGAIAFSADGTRIATGCDDTTVRIWSTSSGDELLVLRGHTGSVFDVEFTGGDQVLVSSGFGRQLRFWDIRPRRERLERWRRIERAIAAQTPEFDSLIANGKSIEAIIEDLGPAREGESEEARLTRFAALSRQIAELAGSGARHPTRLGR